ncbi:heat shock protein HspQ [Sphingorhabdus sp. EL138]|uniref:heat shock protein HspQ n=1 Tax=Sphingorhabdus sp. EL138 TaxID=2073156 RepID=UPI000D69F891|nr:heat shock protein HspQ [Sphingorhabdus sp. EL138]
MAQTKYLASTNPLPKGTPPVLNANFTIGDVVKHRLFDFRGVIYDIDPVFANSDEWYDAIPKDLQPSKDQPFYHLLAENADSSYVAYVSQQNLLEDDSGEPVMHPEVGRMFKAEDDGKYKLHRIHRH